MTTPPPGWYPDQANPQQLRWWNGAAWTAHTQPSQPQPPSSAQHQAAPPQQPYGGQQGPHATPQPQARPPQPPQAYGGQPQPPQPPVQPPLPPQAPPAYAGSGQPPGQPPAQPPHAAPPPAAPQPPPHAAPSPTSSAGQSTTGPLYTDPSIQIVQAYRSAGMLEEASYDVFGQSGHSIGSIRQIRPQGHDRERRIFSADPTHGKGLSEHFELYDHSGGLVLHVARALQAKAASRPRFDVTAADGSPLGVIESEKLVGRITFGFSAGHIRIGGFTAEGMRNRRFVVTDQSGQQVASYDRTPPKGIVNRQEDAYVVARTHPLPEPLGSLVLAGVIAVDNAIFASNKGGPLR